MGSAANYPSGELIPHILTSLILSMRRRRRRGEANGPNIWVRPLACAATGETTSSEKEKKAQQWPNAQLSSWFLNGGTNASFHLNTRPGRTMQCPRRGLCISSSTRSRCFSRTPQQTHQSPWLMHVDAGRGRNSFSIHPAAVSYCGAPIPRTALHRVTPR